MTEYLLAAGDELERRRLAPLERHHDPDSIIALESTGVGPGWECLDVGAGAGSISRWLLKRGAKVLATDLDISGLDGIEARVHDITGDEPLDRTFDLVHTRLVLLHLPSRDQVIERLVALTRHGGWIVVGDIDFSPVTMRPPTLEWTRTWTAWCAATTAGGWDLACGARLLDMLAAAAVRDLHADRTEFEGPGGSDPLLILSLAFERLRPRLVAHGASDADVTAARAALEDPHHRFTAPTTWTAWGRIPSGMAVAYTDWAERHPWTATVAGAAVAAAPLPIGLSLGALDTTEAVLLAVGLFLTIVAVLRLASRVTGRVVVFGPVGRR